MAKPPNKQQIDLKKFLKILAGSAAVAAAAGGTYLWSQNHAVRIGNTAKNVNVVSGSGFSGQNGSGNQNAIGNGNVEGNSNKVESKQTTITNIVSVTKNYYILEPDIHPRHSSNRPYAEATGLYNIANHEYRARKIKTAIRHYRRAIQVDPTFTPAHENLGVALYAQANVNAAKAEWKYALRSEPYNATYLNNLMRAAVPHGGVCMQIQIEPADVVPGMLLIQNDSNGRLANLRIETNTITAQGPIGPAHNINSQGVTSVVDRLGPNQALQFFSRVAQVGPAGVTVGPFGFAPAPSVTVLYAVTVHFVTENGVNLKQVFTFHEEFDVGGRVRFSAPANLLSR